MRQLKFPFFVIMIILFFQACGKHEYNETLTYEPSRPNPGEEITVYYNPTDTPLENIDQIDMVVYLYSVDLDDAVGIEMKKDGDGFVGTFSTLPGSRGALLKFVDRNDYENYDANNKEGYRVILYNDAGEPVKGSDEGLAAAYYFWGTSAGLERDGAKSLAAFNRAFTENTDVKSEYLDSYFNILFRVTPEEADSIVERELKMLEQKSNLNEDELSLLAKWYRKIDLPQKADSYVDEVIEKYPEGDFAQQELFNLFDKAESIVEKVERLKKFEQQFPESPIVHDMYDELILQYRKEGNFDAALRFIKENPNKVHPYYISYVVRKMITDNAEPAIALQMAEEGVKQAEADLQNPAREKPSNLTIKEWDKMRSYYLGMNQYAYGTLLNEQGMTEKAVRVLADAVDNTDKYYNVQDLKNYYADLLIDTGKYQDAMNTISGYIQEGYGSPELKENLRTAYINVKGNEEGFESYLSEFESAAEEDMLTELKDKMINEPAPSFTLTDFEGNEVSLSDYAGKTVVVDFWATWCGPCLRSFPAIKEAVIDYQDNENVKFLFINAWENVDNKKENAEKFINENNYPFHVLMDTNNDVITKFKVEGIPTKFIVGPDQKIKFKSVGYSGNPEQMIKELKMMIGLAGK